MGTSVTSTGVTFPDATTQTSAGLSASTGVQKDSSTGSAYMPTGTTAQRTGSPSAGYTRMNTTLGVEEFYNGSVWLQLGATYSVEFLVVSGGGAGGFASTSYSQGGGGAGGFYAGATGVNKGTGYQVVIGAGGVSQISTGFITTNGGNSSFGSYSTLGGGHGAGNASGVPGNGAENGGSGGGGADTYNAAGLGTSGQGNNGGVGTAGSGDNSGGGGGGASAAGANGVQNSSAGAGGAGTIWPSGGATYYAGGGGGALQSGAGYASGGAGGGGNGNANGTANTGGGGGGAGGQGGSGVVIIRYAGSQIGTGGTVTSAGGYTYHTFTSSGTFTA